MSDAALDWSKADWPWTDRADYGSYLVGAPVYVWLCGDGWRCMSSQGRMSDPFDSREEAKVEAQRLVSGMVNDGLIRDPREPLPEPPA